MLPPSPADALSPSVTVAGSYLFKTADAVVVWGLTGGYAYKLGNTQDDAERFRGFYLGATVGSYIPFFDFN